MVNDDHILTTMRFIPQHEVVQRYSAILPDYLTNPAMKEFEAYKTYHDLATRKVKAADKVAKSRKKKQPAFGLETLSDIALIDTKQLKLAIERSKTQLHISQPSGSGAHEGTDDDDEENVSKHEDDADRMRMHNETKSDKDGEGLLKPDGSKSKHKSASESAHTEEFQYTPTERIGRTTHSQNLNIGALLKNNLMKEKTSQAACLVQKPAKTPLSIVNWNTTLRCYGQSNLEVYKETTNQLDWHNPEGQQYPHDLRKPLPLIPNSRGRQVIHNCIHFINKRPAYLSGGVSSRTYAYFIIKTQGYRLGSISKGNEDFVSPTQSGVKCRTLIQAWT
ncbi:hypothetical protein Tco_0699368 [Tanacetum coccineum]